MQGWFLVEVAPRVELWLSRHLTFGVGAEYDLVHRDSIVAGVTLGLHLMPHD